MFKPLSNLYKQSINDAADNRLIMESITGSEYYDTEKAAEDVIDTDSISQDELDDIDNYVTKRLAGSTEDDMDLDDMLDNDYDEGIVVDETTDTTPVNESSNLELEISEIFEATDVHTPTFDHVGEYNDAIKDGNVDYDMDDCEDRGGVGVNTVMIRNNQLSESSMNESAWWEDEYANSLYRPFDPVNESTLIYEVDSIVEAANEAKSPNLLQKAAAKLKQFVDFVIEKFRDLGRWISTKLRNSKILKAIITWFDKHAVIKKEITVDMAPYSKENLDKINEAATAISKILPIKVGGDVESYKKAVSELPRLALTSERKKMSISEAAKLVNNFDNGKTYKSYIDKFAGEAKLIKTTVNSIDKIIHTNLDGNLDNIKDDDVKSLVKVCSTLIKYLNSMVSTLTKLTNQHESTKKQIENIGIAAARKAMANGQEVPTVLKAPQTKPEKVKSAKQSDAAKSGDKDTVVSEGVELAIKLHNAFKNNMDEAYEYLDSNDRFIQGVYLESTGDYIFPFELNAVLEHADPTGYDYLGEAAGCSTYCEFPELSKHKGTLDVSTIDAPFYPASNLANHDKKDPTLSGSVTMAKNVLAKAYTVSDLANIPISKMTALSKGLVQAVKSDKAAIATLKESYMTCDNPFDRMTIIEDANMIKSRIENMNNTLELIECITTGIEAEASAIFGDFASIDENIFDVSSSSYCNLLAESSDSEDDEKDDEDFEIEDDAETEDKDDDKKKDSKKKSKSESKSKKCDDDDEEDCDDESDDDEKESKSKAKKNSKESKSEKGSKDSEDDEKDEGELDESAIIDDFLSDILDGIW